MNFNIFMGEIADVSTDVVCVSTNPNLELMAGTGGAIREAGGQSIQDECNAVIERLGRETGRRWLSPGSAVRVGAGRLPFQGVILCVAIDPFHDSSEVIIADCARNALDCVARELTNARSIAMPVFATGNGRFDFRIALAAMLDVVADRRDFERVTIVVRDEEQTRTAMDLLTEYGWAAGGN